MLKSRAIFEVTDPGEGSWLKDVVGSDLKGFGALPAGYRFNTGAQFTSRGTTAYYLSTSVLSTSKAWSRFFDFNMAKVNRSNTSRSSGYSVRCVRD
jgi:uncharacterized protein (TIGR02145 family)